jgi:hypothetical protein
MGADHPGQVIADTAFGPHLASDVHHAQVVMDLRPIDTHEQLHEHPPRPESTT